MVEWGRGMAPPPIEGTCHVSLQCSGAIIYMWVLYMGS